MCRDLTGSPDVDSESERGGLMAMEDVVGELSVFRYPFVFTWQEVSIYMHKGNLSSP
jgi:hypothetical protein